MQVPPSFDPDEHLSNRSLFAALLTALLRLVADKFIPIMNDDDCFVENVLIDRNVIFGFKLPFYFDGQLQILVYKGPIIIEGRQLVVEGFDGFGDI